MKPCIRKRKLITWFALGALDERRASELRAHLTSCERCDEYLREITSTAQTLTAINAATTLDQLAPDQRPSFARNRSVAPFRLRIFAAFASIPKISLVGQVTLGALVLLLACVVLVLRNPHSARPTKTQVVTTPHLSEPAIVLNPDVSPTLANYLLVASRSLDQFDDLLTKQAQRPSPSRGDYRISAITESNLSD